jgi:hypothetical protein
LTVRRKTLKLFLVLSLLLSLASLALAADNYITTTHYKIYYDQWEDVAKALNTSYLDTAYDTAAGVLGGGLDSLMSIYFYSSPKSSTNGSYSPSNNTIKLNIRNDSTSSSTLTTYAAVLAHETSHAIFNFISHNSSDAANWLDEGLAFYVGDCAYPKSGSYSTKYLGAQLKYYSSDGAKKQSWYDTGIDYLGDNTSSLAMWSLPAIGNFLYSTGGSNAILTTLKANGSGKSLEASLEAGFGKASGMKSTDTSANTLYADYYKFYYGSS